MAENMTMTPIPPDRCTPGGVPGVGASGWALRAGSVMLFVAALWFAFVAVKPMPSGVAASAPEIPGLTVPVGVGASIEQRQARLAAINSGGNIFASDRRDWPVQAAKAPASDAGADETPGRAASGQPVLIHADSQAIDHIELAENVPTAVKKRLDQLKLRGVYVVGGEPAAMIGQKTNPSSEIYRVGDTLGDGEWRLVAIDDTRDRVILNRSGLNFELTLYDTVATAHADTAPRTSISAAIAPGGVEIGFTSLDRVATELREAGVTRDQINDLITLAQAPQAEKTEAGESGESQGESNKPVVIPPAMPPGMVQLFRAMAEGSRNVVAPPAVAPLVEEAISESSDKATDNASVKTSDKKNKDDAKSN